jgi:hypothetical protein
MRFAILVVLLLFPTRVEAQDPVYYTLFTRPDNRLVLVLNGLGLPGREMNCPAKPVRQPAVQQASKTSPVSDPFRTLANFCQIKGVLSVLLATNSASFTIDPQWVEDVKSSIQQLLDGQYGSRLVYRPQ